ncbi:hypothetical protein NKDENANG_03554 [Candidatus Entotheonellaceae bacterium PAL068K]
MVAAPAAPSPNDHEAPANDWLQRTGWKQVWPYWPFGKRQRLLFAGPPIRRYLRLQADRIYYWSRRVDIDRHQFPSFSITWGVEQFPHDAALDVYGRTDHSIAILVSFGSKVSSPGLLPDVPRTLAFFWGATETVGALYTCITPRHGPADRPLQCKYPHIKYIALRRGGTGSVHTDRVNLVESFQQYFPTYWQQNRRVPPVGGVSFEARTNKTRSRSSARLYTITFTADASRNGELIGVAPEED